MSLLDISGLFFEHRRRTKILVDFRAFTKIGTVPLNSNIYRNLKRLLCKFQALDVFTTSNSLAEGVTAGASLVYRDAARQKRPRTADLERWAILSAPGFVKIA